jgi:curved DNA-binding protein CbpA
MKKDYYAILGVGRDASPEEVRRAYRKKALELHPDRNGGSREAEESFKELTEAYAVLGDPDRRAAYEAHAGKGENYAPQDLFADLFAHPALGGLFAQLAREFHGHGLRFDQAYLHRVFQQQRGNVYFGGFVFVGPLTGLFSQLHRRSPEPKVQADEPNRLPRRPGLLGRLLNAALPRPKGLPDSSGDVRYALPVPPDLLSRGGPIRIAVPGPSGTETYEVRVPAGSTPGTRLRLAGRGKGTDTRGDLYLELRSAT